MTLGIIEDRFFPFLGVGNILFMLEQQTQGMPRVALGLATPHCLRGHFADLNISFEFVTLGV